MTISGKLEKNWGNIKINKIETQESDVIQVCENIKVKANISLPGLSPEDVFVEIYSGLVNFEGNLEDEHVFPMQLEKKQGCRGLPAGPPRGVSPGPLLRARPGDAPRRSPSDRSYRAR